MRKTYQISEKGLKCYERRSRCLKHRGWCYAGRNREFGFCNEIVELPDTPDPEDPLFEVPTFILPKQDCKSANLVSSESRICTGYVSRGPSEYIFQVWTWLSFLIAIDHNTHCLGKFYYVQ